MSIKEKVISGALWLLSPLALADVYQVYFTDNAEITSNGAYINYVKIVNTSSYTTYDGNIAGYYSQSFTDLETAAAAHHSGETFGAAMNHDLSSSPVSMLDFTGTSLKLRANRAVNVGSTTGPTEYWYDVVNTVNLTNGAVTETILVASSQDEYDIARAAGYTVMLDESNIDRSTNGVSFTSFSTNITNKNGSTDAANEETKGGFLVEQISGVDGSSLLRQEDDGTIHLGENSVVIAPSTDGGTTPDMIYSSAADGSTLQIGNISTHHTKIMGTAEITGSLDMNSNRITDLGTPINSSDAATKGYVDSLIGNSVSQQYVDSIAAMSTAVASMPQAGLGETMLSVGTGYRDGQSALALGITSRPSESPVSFNVNAAYSNTASKPTYGAGLGWKF